MGIDIGFDLFPPLENNEHDQSIWASFITEIERTYAYDSLVVPMATIIEFEVGILRSHTKAINSGDSAPKYRGVRKQSHTYATFLLLRNRILAIGCISGPSMDMKGNQNVSSHGPRFMQLEETE